MDFSKFFANFDSPDSIAILIILLVAFLFGMLFGSIIRGIAVRRLKRELDQKQQELTVAQSETARLQEELNLREADLRKAQFEVEENKTKVTRLADEKTKLYNEVYSLNTELENLKKSGGTPADSAELIELNATVERLNAQITALQSQNKQLEDELTKVKNTAPPAPTTETHEDAAVDYLAQFQSMQNALRGRLETLEEKLNKVESENAALKGELDDIKTAGIVANAAVPVVENRSTKEATSEEPVLNFGANKAVLMDPILRKAADRDDLTRINGISPFLEKKLNDAGIYTYEQIGHWDPSDVHQIVQKIGYLPGQIEREDWMGQAIKLAEKNKEKPPSFETRGINYPNQPDDLKIIEGIGPKIEGLLKAAGIHTWEELSEATADQLRNILHEAGESYRIHDPTTWPAQARLAANGSWELLREYQDQLKGGREVH